MCKKLFFKGLAKLNRLILPSMAKKGLVLNRLNKRQKLMVAYRYWVTKNSVD